MNNRVSALEIQAAELLRAAEAAQPDEGSTAWTILVESGGQIRIISDCESPLSNLQLGGARVFRVRRVGDAIRVEGREGVKSCVLETGAPEVKPKLLISTSAPIAEIAESGPIVVKPPAWCTTDDPAGNSGIDAYINLAKLREESVPPLPEASD